MQPEEMMAEGAQRMLDGVERLAVGWVVAQVTTILDGQHGLGDAERMYVLERAQEAGEQARNRVLGELRELFSQPPAAQRSTPLAIVRSLRREPTALLADAGVPPVVRDAYDARAFPDDLYGIVPKAITEIGDDELGGALLAWGIGKAKAVQSLPNKRTGC
ncbi:MAG TPA: hypothetical protein VL856_03900 [Acidimicrobiia bacterium]|jgi:hypothetical protein|nr:hypothetical protein [Acidimicrobiia bacterium]